MSPGSRRSACRRRLVRTARTHRPGGDSSSTATITIAIGTNPGSGGGGTLSGTLTAVASSGVATFSGLSIDKQGNGYTLNATSAGLSTATSSPFNITP